MKVKAWAFGLIAALAGCTGADRRYEPPSRGPLLGDGSYHVPPGARPAWQQYAQVHAARRPAPRFSPVAADSMAYSQPTRPAPVSDALGASDPSAPVSLAAAPPAAGPTPIRQAGLSEKPVKVLPTEDTMADRAPPIPSPKQDEPDLARPPVARADPDLPPLPDLPLTEPTDPPKPEPMPVAVGEELDGPPPPPLPPLPGLAGQEGQELERKEPADLPAPRAEERPAGSPPVRMVNSRRIAFNYEVKDVGPSGVSAVELWYTTDGGRTWQKDEKAPRSGPPYVAEVEQEGTYGFTLVARNGIGLGKEPPKSGELPQVWVEVDMTKPTVALAGIQNGHGPKAREVTVTWSAKDRNLTHRPITLFYAEKLDGPWVPFAANIDNTGRYVWTMPESAPNRFLVRVEASDLVGNVGVAQTAKQFFIDMSQPTVSILAVESVEK